MTLGVSPPRQRLALTLTPGVDFDLDLVNARIRDGTELKKRADELAQQTEGLKKQTEELELSSAQILAAGFDAAFEQFACQYPDLDLSMVSLNNEVVDGKIVPFED